MIVLYIWARHVKRNFCRQVRPSCLGIFTFLAIWIVIMINSNMPDIPRLACNSCRGGIKVCIHFSRIPAQESWERKKEIFPSVAIWIYDRSATENKTFLVIAIWIFIRTVIVLISPDNYPRCWYHRQWYKCKLKRARTKIIPLLSPSTFTGFFPGNLSRNVQKFEL